MTETRQQVYEQAKELFGQVPTWLEIMPDEAMPHFFGLMRDFDMGETVIPNKYKDLIGLAVSGATRCHYCTYFHMESAKMWGATEAEIREASMQAATTMAGSTFINAMHVDYDEFKQQTDEMVAYAKEQLKKNGAKKAKKNQRPHPSA